MRGKNIKMRMAAAVLVCLLGLSLWPAAPPAALAAAGDLVPVGLVIDGRELQTDDPALLTQGRTLVPLRILMEALGARVDWEEEQRTVTVTRAAGPAVKLWVDNRLVCYDDGGSYSYDVCDVAPRIMNDRTYVPLRLVGGALGISVEWDEASRRVVVDTSIAGVRSRFFDLAIAGVQPGQMIADSLPLSLQYGGQAPAGAAQVKYFFLNPQTGEGKIAARTADAGGAAQWTPDLAGQGPGILAAAVCDSAGNFLAGAAVGVTLALQPRVTLLGLTEGQAMTGSLTMSSAVNFLARSVEYEFTVLADGSSTRSVAFDPADVCTHVPPAGQTGGIAVRAIATDAAGNEYPSPAVTVQANVAPPDSTPRVNLRSFNADHVGKMPVTLSITRNFDAVTTQYWAQNSAGGEPVLLAEKPWGDHVWFPGPDMAGTWELYVRVTAPGGQVYTSNPRTATVAAAPSLILNGVGPGQVVTGEVKLHATANVALQNVAYIISNPGNGSQATMGQAADTAEEVAWSPAAVNEGERRMQAVGTLADGTTVQSEPVSVKIYLGQLYTARPVVAKDQFVDMVTPMALNTQKQNGMSAALQVAQAILETGWGQSLPVDKYTGLFSNNLFGIKGSGSAGSVVSGTLEEYYGTMYRIDANFRAYHNVQESWDDHNNLLLRMERYQPYRDVMFHSTSGAYALKRCGYATDSAYPGKLITIINQYGLDRLDYQKL